MFENLNDALQFIVPLTLVFLGIAIHAFRDANKKREETELLYNKQPRVKPLRKQLAWSGRIMNIILLRKFY